MKDFVLIQSYQALALAAVAAVLYVVYRRTRGDNRYVVLLLVIILGGIAVVTVATAPMAYRKQQAREASFRQMSGAQHLAEAKRLWDGGGIMTSPTYKDVLQQISDHVDAVSPQEPGRIEFVQEVNAAIAKHGEPARKAAEYRAKVDAAKEAVDAAEKTCPAFLDAPIGNKPCPQLTEAKEYLKAVESEPHDTP
jgi:type II secretory pathway pseudopilin PulG